jgi:uncharacterized protein (DUF488 family)
VEESSLIDSLSFKDEVCEKVEKVTTTVALFLLDPVVDSIGHKHKSFDCTERRTWFCHRNG